MTHANAWHVYMDEPYHASIDVASELTLTSAELRVRGLPVIPLTITAITGGFRVEGDLMFVIPGMFDWSVEVGDSLGNEPLVVAVGYVRVDRRVRTA